MRSQEVMLCGAVCRYPGKGIAHVSYSMALDAPIEATVFGTKGTVKVHDRAHNPTKHIHAHRCAFLILQRHICQDLYGETLTLHNT